MKRWTSILGRSGTTLIAISLALFLVSFIPAPQLDSGDGVTEVPARTFSPLNRMPPFMASMFSHYDVTLTPQQGIELELSANGTVTAYILKVESYTLVTWTSEQQQVSGLDFNVTRLDEFLDAHPGVIGWQHEIDEETVTHTYIPTKITNVTIVYSNPSSENVTVHHVYNLKSFLAPGEKVRTIAYCATPIGVILAIPWLLNSWKQRKHK